MINTEKFKKEPTSLAVSDLQLLIAFYMRKGLDLTNFMHQQANAAGEPELVIEYVGDGKIFDNYIKLVAKFNSDGRNVFIKHINFLAEDE